MNVVEQYWTGAVRRLQTEVDVFNKLIGHAGEQGRENELALARMLQNLVPRKLGIGSGIIIDNNDKRSNQTDIVIYDFADQSSIMAQTTQVIFPIESVHSAVEVKTTLTAEELIDCGKKKEALYALQPTNGKHPSFVVLAYSAWARPSTVAKHLRGLKIEQQPDLLCILDPGIVSGAALGATDDIYPVAVVPLHQRDDEGSRIASKWLRPDLLPGSAELSAYGSTYPVTFHSGNELVVGEPGRALLLFLDGLLHLLHKVEAIPYPFLSNYLTDTAREVLDLPSV